MSVFPRIDPQHPLAEAARIVNAQAEEIGLDATIDWLGMDVSMGELAYLAEQRALRAVAAAQGYNMGLNPAQDERVARKILGSEEWEEQGMMLIAAYMDALAIGWKARELHGGETWLGS